MRQPTTALQDSKQLFVIDGKIDAWRDLANNLDIGAAVLILDPTRDGLIQIAETIASYSNLDAIHIISHGNVGSIQLGASTLTSDNLQHYTSQLTIIGNALSENGDILLYGCNVAQGDKGNAFIKQLSLLTGADVAASINLTGAASQGGDWNLEVTTGFIDSPVMSATKQYALTLAVGFSITGTTGNDTLGGNDGNDTLDGEAGDDTYLFGIGSGNDTISEYVAKISGGILINGSNGIDHVVFTDLKQADVNFSKANNGNGLIVTITSSGETLTINNAFSTDIAWNVESFQFTDGVVNLAQVININNSPTSSVQGNRA